MPERTCAGCDASVPPRGKSRFWCAACQPSVCVIPSCAKGLGGTASARARGWCDMHYMRFKLAGGAIVSHIVVTDCAYCGTVFVAERTPGKPHQWCSTACRAARNAATERSRRTSRVCEGCGATFLSNKRARFCRKCCAAAVFNVRARRCACGREVQPDVVRCAVCRRAALWAVALKRLDVARPSTKRAWSAGPCAECGVAFVSTSGVARVCSRACRTRRNRRAWSSKYGSRSHRARARKAGVGYDPVSLRAVYEDSSWRCGICGNPVDPTLKYPHPWSASVDHIVPFARGGAHLRDNLQCAHLACNVAKSDTLPT